MNEGIHLDLDTWIVPGQIRKANLCRGLGNRYTPIGKQIHTNCFLIANLPVTYILYKNNTNQKNKKCVIPHLPSVLPALSTYPVQSLQYTGLVSYHIIYYYYLLVLNILMVATGSLVFGEVCLCGLLV